MNWSILENAAIYTCSFPNSRNYIFFHFQLFGPKMSYRKNADLINSGKLKEKNISKLSKKYQFLSKLTVLYMEESSPFGGKCSI